MTSRNSDALALYGWTEATRQRYPWPEQGLAARVVRADRGLCTVATTHGLERCRMRPEQSSVPGDWAVVRRAGDGSLELVTVYPRITEIRRGNAAGTGVHTLAANVDTLLALHGFDRPHRVGRLQRLCILAWEAGVSPVVVLTKRDLMATGGAVITLAAAAAEVAGALPGVAIHPVSGLTGEGLDALTRYLEPGATVALAGESGSGKSTLINRLAGEDRQATGRTRTGDNKGRHTTTWRELVPVPGGATILDMPGIRMVPMTGASAGLAPAYEDVHALAGRCRFRDCSHISEPGCAVQQALRDGLLPEARWTGYQKLAREMAYEARRATERARRVESRRSRRRPSLE